MRNRIAAVVAPWAGLALVASLALVAPAALAAGVTVSHGTSLQGTLKYGPEFAHFEYVNPDAPKGGEVRQSATGSFDSLNPFILKGTPAAFIVFFASDLSPMRRIASGEGPMNLILHCPHNSAKSAFSARKP